ncbi:MAG: tetratricopeptide repeat protein [Chloroflexi bacterium]|nr:tetratricopeptide repeat protein [Chloroflexota bacterium]
MSDPVFERYKEALKQGHLALLRGRPQDALERYTEAAALADHRALPHLSVGSVLLQLGRADDALSAYERAVTRAPEDPAGHAGRASALSALGRPAEAAAATAQATAIAELVARRRSDAATAADEAARGAGPEALLESAEAQGSGGKATAVDRFVAAADLYLARSELDAASDACQRALALAPGSPAVHLAMRRAAGAGSAFGGHRRRRARTRRLGSRGGRLTASGTSA